MSNFSQKHTKITTFYLLQGNPPSLKAELRHHSKWKKAILVIPLLASEFTDPANRPVFINIIKQLRGTSFLSKIVFGLDQASEADARDLAGILSDHDMKNCLIQHNDGPGFSSIYETLSREGFALDIRGKGRNMFLSFGIALALGAQSIEIGRASCRERV